MSTTTSTTLPETCRALICHTLGKPLTIETIPTPAAGPGSVVIKVLAAIVAPTTSEVLAGNVPGLTFPTPFGPGSNGIGRVAAIGPDTTSLEIGQLVLTEPFIRARDDPDVQILWGLSEGASPQSKRLMANHWSQGLYAEYVRAPLENCHLLNEKLLTGSPDQGGLGYSVNDLLYLSRMAVAYGGLRGINLQAGETIIVAPATGSFSGAAVELASAMGARVIAVGRNLSTLQRLARYNPRVFPVQLTGDVEADTASIKAHGNPAVDAYIDISPPQASKSTHVRSCFLSLKQYARVSLMGLMHTDIAVPYGFAMFQNLTIRGQFMFERQDVRDLIKLAESGVLKLGPNAGQEIVAEFPLDKWDEAFETTAKHTETGKMVLITP